MNSKHQDPQVVLCSAYFVATPSDGNAETNNKHAVPFSCPEQRAVHDYLKKGSICSESKTTPFEKERSDKAENPYSSPECTRDEQTKQPADDLCENPANTAGRSSRISDQVDKVFQVSGLSSPQFELLDPADKGFNDNCVSSTSTLLENTGRLVANGPEEKQQERATTQSRCSETSGIGKEGHSCEANFAAPNGKSPAKTVKKGYAEVCEMARCFFSLDWESVAIKRAKHFPGKIVVSPR